MKKILATYCAFFLCLTVMWGQALDSSTSLEVVSIQFQGNKKSKTSFLEYHLSLEIGQSYSESDIIDHIMALSRLNGIYDVQYNLGREQGQAHILIQIEEQRTLLPVVNFGRADQYSWFQLGFVDINFLGRGDEIYSYYQNNAGRHTGQLYYRKPRIRKTNVGFAVNLLKWASIEPLYFEDQRVLYNFDNNLFGLSLYYMLNRNWTAEIGGSFFNENYERRDFTVDIENAPAALNLNKALFKLALNYDGLSYYQNFISGHHLATSYQFVETFEQQQPLFNIVEARYRYFKKFGNKSGKTNSNLAFRAVVGLATNNDSPFSPFVIDSYKNIRGVGDRVERGTAILSLNTEYRYQVWAGNNWAIQTVAFLDIGTIRQPQAEVIEAIRSEQINEFAGIGCRFIYKKIFNGLIRVDYAVDLSAWNNRHFVLGLGQYF